MQGDQELHAQTGEGMRTGLAEPAEPGLAQRLGPAIARAAAVVEGVVRSSTLISLATQVSYRVLPLVRAAASGTGPQRSAARHPSATALSRAGQAVC